MAKGPVCPECGLKGKHSRWCQVPLREKHPPAPPVTVSVPSPVTQNVPVTDSVTDVDVETESGGGVVQLTREETLALIDREARSALGISGEEFARRWEAGEIEDPDGSPNVMHIVMLLPLLDGPATECSECGRPYCPECGQPIPVRAATCGGKCRQKAWRKRR